MSHNPGEGHRSFQGGLAGHHSPGVVHEPCRARGPVHNVTFIGGLDDQVGVCERLVEVEAGGLMVGERWR